MINIFLLFSNLQRPPSPADGQGGVALQHHRSRHRRHCLLSWHVQVSVDKHFSYNLISFCTSLFFIVMHCHPLSLQVRISAACHTSSIIARTFTSSFPESPSDPHRQAGSYPAFIFWPTTASPPPPLKAADLLANPHNSFNLQPLQELLLPSPPASHHLPFIAPSKTPQCNAPPAPPHHLQLSGTRSTSLYFPPRPSYTLLSCNCKLKLFVKFDRQWNIEWPP